MDSKRGRDLERDIVSHLDELHSLELPVDLEIERLLLNDELAAVKKQDKLNFEKGLVTFSPSSASKCKRELFYKANRIGRDEQTRYPYQRRWARNGTAVHGAVQKDLLYAEKYLAKPKFKVQRTETGRPAWERNLRQVKKFDHNEVRFQMSGMMDGILIYTPDSSRIGFEFKTKSTTIAAVGDYKMKEIQESHKEQCIGYSLLFDLNEFIVLYESLAKDSWMKGIEAKSDLRPFYLEITDKAQKKMLDKFAKVAKMVEDGELPDSELGKCIFCPYKSRCIGEAA